VRFDWYQPTVPETPQVIVDELLARLAPGGEVREGAGRHNYRQSFTIQSRDGDPVAVVLCGGPNGDPNLTASGAACDAFVPVVRELWPEHRVSRADVAEDFAGEGVYDRLEGACRAVYRELGVKGRAIVPDDPRDGRTYYGGAPSSDVRVRLYDKTAEARRHLPEARHAEVPDHWARLECQVRPRNQAKDMACRMRPEQFWGCARWTAQLAAMAMRLDVDRIAMNPARESDHDRAYRFLLQQYGRTFLRLLHDHGSWAAVGAQIGDDLKRMGNGR
jgi:hypothetical protein